MALSWSSDFLKSAQETKKAAPFLFGAPSFPLSSFGAAPSAPFTFSAQATDAVTVVSHTHGRARREERGVERAELQAAVKYGRRERAHPGASAEQLRDGFA